MAEVEIAQAISFAPSCIENWTMPRQMVLSDPGVGSPIPGDGTGKQHRARVNHALTNAA
jgi:hypothetical protein